MSDFRFEICSKRTIVFTSVATVLIALAVTYAGLAVYKADDYTTTPRQNTSAIAPPSDGLTYRNVVPVAAIPEIEELNIGHSIVSRALAVGMRAAVEEMLHLVRDARR